MLVVKGAFDMRPPEGLVFIPIGPPRTSGAFDMRPPEGLVFIPIGPPRTSEQILVRRRNAALSSAAEAFWAHAARSAERDDSAD